MSHALYPLLPLSQTVTPSRTPSSVTYFMDGPYGGRGSRGKNFRFFQTKIEKFSQFPKIFNFFRLKFLTTFFPL